MTRAARDQDAHGVECLHCVLLDGQFIYANADQNVEVGVVAATRPVDAIMSPAVVALHSARDATPDCVAQTLEVGEGSPPPRLSTRNPCNHQLSPPLPKLIGRQALAKAA
jgi:hypothetical protein